MRNETLQSWILLVAAHTKPARIHWCEGSDAELAALSKQLQEHRELQPLNEQTYPGCYLHRDDTTHDTSLEQRRFVCTATRELAGPTNRWLNEPDAYRVVWPLFSNAMSGRTLYVVPYLLGPQRSKYAQVGVQLTDSPLLVLLLAALTRMGRVARQHLGSSSDFARGLHCLGGDPPGRRYLVQFPASQTSWCIGVPASEGAALLKSHVLGLSGALAPEEGYLAEHMAVARITRPSGARHYVAAAFPAGCGKTRLATLQPCFSGWEVELVADGLCWLRAGDDGRLWAMNPAAGIDGRIGDSDRRVDPATPAAFARDAILTNVAVRSDGSPWWEGSAEPPGEGLLDWRGNRWTRGAGTPAAHPDARFVTTGHHWSRLAGEFYSPLGVPLSALVFGGRRRDLAPLIFEATSWAHGVYAAATSRSEVCTGAVAAAGALRNDPMAMLPFCSYNVADYLEHWLRLGRQLHQPPRIFHANWFRRDAGGRLLWPGFGQNLRVLDWILARAERATDARLTPLGLLPNRLDTTGLDLHPDVLEQLLQVDVRGWLQETEASREFLERFGQRLPRALWREHHALVQRLRAATN